MKSKKKLQILSLFILLSMPAFADTWYVNPASGNDGNNGSSSSPFRTILQASDYAQPGDEIVIKNGNYTGFKDSYGRWNDPKGDGSSSAWITIRPETPGGVILDGAGVGCPDFETPILKLTQVRYVIVRDLIMKNNACGKGVWINNCYFTTLKNCTIDNMFTHGIMVQGEDITLDGNTVSNTVKNNTNNNNRDGGWNQAIGTWAIDYPSGNAYCKRIKYINNTVFDNWGEGMILIMVQDGLMENNTVYNNFSVQLYADNATNITIRNNHAYATKDLYNRGCCGRPAGISVAVEAGGYPLTQNADDIRIYNNLVSGTSKGIYWYNYGAGSYSNIQIYHNVFHDIRGSHAIDFNSAGSGTNSIRNNIIYSGTSGAYNLEGNWNLSNNSYPSGTPSGAGTGNVPGNPGFAVASPNGTIKTDFRLSSTSPLRRAGTGISSVVPKDFWGTTRSTTTPSIGIHEVTGTSTITPTTLQAENAEYSGAAFADIHAGYTGTGYIDYINASGDYIEWSVEVPTAGSYVLGFRYALASTTNRPLDLSINGVAATSQLSFPLLENWATWDIANTTVSLNAGVNTVRVTAAGSSGPNLDYLEVSPISANLRRAVAEKTQEPESVRFLPNPASQTVAVSLAGLEAGKAELVIYNAAGTVVSTRSIQATSPSATEQIELSSLRDGTYTVILKQGGKTIANKLVVVKE